MTPGWIQFWATFGGVAGSFSLSVLLTITVYKLKRYLTRRAVQNELRRAILTNIGLLQQLIAFCTQSLENIQKDPQDPQAQFPARHGRALLQDIDKAFFSGEIRTLNSDSQSRIWVIAAALRTFNDFLAHSENLYMYALAQPVHEQCKGDKRGACEPKLRSSFCIDPTGRCILGGCAGPAKGTAEWHAHQGYKLWDDGHYDEAIEEYTKAIELDPNLPELYACRASAYNAKAQYDLAIADLYRLFGGLNMLVCLKA